MATLESDQIEQEILSIVKTVCKQQNIDEKIDADFCPGKFIMSQVLVSIVPEIENKIGISIPLECYIFYDNKNKEQLSIKDAVAKLLKVKHEQSK